MKRRKRQCARGRATIDEECGSAAHPGIGTLSSVFGNGGSIFASVDTGIELRHIELEVRCQLFDVREVQGIRIGEQRIMQFPILILVPRAAGGFSGFPCVGMDAVQRKILKYKLDFIFVGFTDFGEFRLNSSAVRSLIVGEFDNRHRGFVGATGR